MGFRIRMWTFPLAVAAALLAAQDGLAFTWADRADVIGESFGRGLHAGGAIDSRIYIAGGGYIGTSLWGSYRSTVIYDALTDTWSSGPDMAELRTAPASAVATILGEPRLFVFGGMDLTDFPVFQYNHTSIEAYDPVARTWQTMGATLPDIETFASCAVTVDNTVYIMGGCDDTLSVLTSRVVAYDPDSDAMTPKAPMPAGASDGACAAVGRSIYWFGGYSAAQGWGTPPVNRTFIYDVDLDSWSASASSMPTPRADAAAIAVGTTVYVIGGWDGSGQYFGLYNTVDAYDTTSDTWTGDVPDPIGCVADDGSSARGRAGLTLHLANNGVEDLLFAVGGNLGISVPTRCNESAPLAPSSDKEPPVFAGLESAEEVYCATPEVLLQWLQGTDALSPPVVYNVYRGTTPAFIPDATSRIAARVTGATYKDTLTAADCYKSFWYVVRAEDSAAPPNEDTNTRRAQVDLLCQAPGPPANIGNRLRVVKAPSGEPELDWSAYVPAPAVTHYHVRRTVAKVGLPGTLIDEPTALTWIDATAPGASYLYEIRAAIDCMDMESDD